MTDRRAGARDPVRRVAFLPILLVAPVFGLVGCAPDDTAGGEDTTVAPADAPAGSPDGGTYERGVAFFALDGDTALVVPWLLEARTLPGAVRRSAQGLLARGTAVERFFADTWESPRVGDPWQILPRGPMRLIVGAGDALERIVFDEGARQLQLALGEPLVEWTGPRGENFRLLEGTLTLADTPTQGFVVDVSRAWRSAAPSPPGDWGFLVSGDSLQLIVSEPNAASDGERTFRAWARLDFRTLQWPQVRAEWTRTRTFDPARREVPAAWSFRVEGDLAIDVDVVGSDMQAGAGEGPQLPVEAFQLVRGTVHLEGGEYPVDGLIRHLQR